MAKLQREKKRPINLGTKTRLEYKWKNFSSSSFESQSQCLIARRNEELLSILMNSLIVLESPQLLGSLCSMSNSVHEFARVEDRGCVLGGGVYNASYLNYAVERQEKQVADCSSQSVESSYSVWCSICILIYRWWTVHSQGDLKALWRVFLRDRKQARGSDQGPVAVWSIDKEDICNGQNEHN